MPRPHALSVRFCISLRVVCITGVVYFGVCAFSAVAARHGDPEGVCVLQFHLVLIRHFDEGTPCKGVTETSAKPVRKKKRGGGALSFGITAVLTVNMALTFGSDSSR